MFVSLAGTVSGGAVTSTGVPAGGSGPSFGSRLSSGQSAVVFRPGSVRGPM